MDLAELRIVITVILFLIMFCIFQVFAHIIFYAWDPLIPFTTERFKSFVQTQYKYKIPIGIIKVGLLLIVYIVFLCVTFLSAGRIFPNNYKGAHELKALVTDNEGIPLKIRLIEFRDLFLKLYWRWVVVFGLSLIFCTALIFIPIVLTSNNINP